MYTPRKDTAPAKNTVFIPSPRAEKVYSPRLNKRLRKRNKIPKTIDEGYSKSIPKSPEAKPPVSKAPILKRKEKLKKSISIDGWCQSSSPVLT